MSYLRGALGVLVGGGSAGIVFGALARWFNPCVGMSRFATCSHEVSDTLLPCYMETCDVSKSGLLQALQIMVMLALFAGSGFVAALIAGRWHRSVGALAAMLVVPVTIAVADYLFPYAPTSHHTFLDVILTLFGLAIVGVIGLATGRLGRRLTNRAAASQ